MKQLLPAILCMILVVFSPPRHNLAAQERPMSLVFFNDYAPFSMVVDGQVTGILIEALTEVLHKKMHLPITVQSGPWARMQEFVKDGRADAFCTVPNDARKAYVGFSQVPTIVVPYRIFTHKDSAKLAVLQSIHTLEDLRREGRARTFTIGHFLGAGWHKTNLENHNVPVDYAPSQEGSTLKVALRRVDALVNNAVVARYHMKVLSDKLKEQNDMHKAEAVKNIIELDAVLDTVGFNLGISKKSPYLQYLEAFEKQMEQASKDGLMEELLKKYQ